MRDDDPLLGGASAGLQDEQAVGGVHLEAVDELVQLDLNGHTAANELQDFREVGVLERETALDLVVVLVEGAAGDDDADGHGVFRTALAAAESCA